MAKKKSQFNYFGQLKAHLDILKWLKFSVLAHLKQLFGLWAGGGHTYQRVSRLHSDQELAVVILLY